MDNEKLANWRNLPCRTRKPRRRRPTGGGYGDSIKIYRKRGCFFTPFGILYKIKNIVVTITFFGVIVILLLANIIKKDGQISISERRKLEQFPAFSITKLFNGTFFDKMDKYLTDQFIKREEFRRLKIGMEFNVLKKKDYISNLSLLQV